ncbi:hypothetical protein GCM10023208_13370 [Erythrobacter westpacificensis]|uniref:Uncharacterized protein n=1 Tax=Erythrobacter westpacificensis TaxID=1055231 RepID=A0ABP9K943_9SPHN
MGQRVAAASRANSGSAKGSEAATAPAPSMAEERSIVRRDTNWEADSWSIGQATFGKRVA